MLSTPFISDLFKNIVLHNEILFFLAYFRLNVMKIPFGTCINLTKSHMNCQNINSYNRCNVFSIMSRLVNEISHSTNHLKRLKYS